MAIECLASADIGGAFSECIFRPNSLAITESVDEIGNLNWSIGGGIPITTVPFRGWYPQIFISHNLIDIGDESNCTVEQVGPSALYPLLAWARQSFCVNTSLPYLESETEQATLSWL